MPEWLINWRAQNDIARCWLEMDWRPTVVVAVKNSEGRFLIVESAKGSSGFVQGGVNQGEKLTGAVRRELLEEVDLGVVGLQLFGITDLEFRKSGGDKRGFKRGKRYFVLGGNSDGEPRVDGREIVGFRWVDSQELKQIRDALKGTSESHRIPIFDAVLRQI